MKGNKICDFYPDSLTFLPNLNAIQDARMTKKFGLCQSPKNDLICLVSWAIMNFPTFSMNRPMKKKM